MNYDTESDILKSQGALAVCVFMYARDITTTLTTVFGANSLERAGILMSKINGLDELDGFSGHAPFSSTVSDILDKKVQSLCNFVFNANSFNNNLYNQIHTEVKHGDVLILDCSFCLDSVSKYFSNESSATFVPVRLVKNLGNFYSVMQRATDAPSEILMPRRIVIND